MSLQRVADAFWTSVTDPEIADIFFGHARSLQRNKTSTGPSDSVAAKHYKGDLSRVVAIVRSRNIDPEILRKFAKDTRVSVRQELLENPNTPRDVLVELMVWKFERNDGDLVACAERLTLVELLDVFGRFSAKHGENRGESLELPADGVISCVTEEPLLAVRLAQAGPLSLVALLAKAAHDGLIPGVSLSDILDARPDVTEKALHHVLAARKHLTTELATRWRQLRDDPETRLYRHFGFNTELFDLVEDGAADILVGGDVAQLHTAVLHGASNHVLSEAFNVLDVEELRYVIEVLNRREFSIEAEQALVDRVLAVGVLGKFPLQQLLEELRYQLDDQRLVKLLRLCGARTLSQWLLSENLVNGPRPGIIPILGTNPRWRALNHEIAVDLTSTDMIHSLIFCGGRDPRMAGEVIALYDTYIGGHLTDRNVAAMVYPLLEKAFAGSEQRASWEMFLSLAADWSGTLTDVVAAVQGLLGTTPQEFSSNTDSSCVELVKRTFTDEQLVLL